MREGVVVTQAVTFVAQMPCLSHAARSHTADRAKSAPASQAAFLCGLLLLEYIPTQKTVGTHIMSQEIAVTRSEWCVGV